MNQTTNEFAAVRALDPGDAKIMAEFREMVALARAPYLLAIVKTGN